MPLTLRGGQAASHHQHDSTMPKAENTVLVPPSECKQPRSDLSGRRFSRLVVLGFAGMRVTSCAAFQYWTCKCDCGNTTTVAASMLHREKTKSCGCIRIETVRAMNTVHGQAPESNATPEYQTWMGMKMRCLNPNSVKYPRYGGRGITVCQRWLDSFENFFADMGVRPPDKTSIHRVNNDGHYEPGNCVWADGEEQGAEKSSNAYFANAYGRTMIREHWARLPGMSRQRVATMIKKGFLTRTQKPEPSYV